VDARSAPSFDLGLVRGGIRSLRYRQILLDLLSQQGLYYLCMSNKNNLSSNNLDYQTYTPRLYNLNYNLNYIIYKLKQTCVSYPSPSDIPITYTLLVLGERCVADTLRVTVATQSQRFTGKHEFSLAENLGPAGVFL
jgi:hypothetical protein